MFSAFEVLSFLQHVPALDFSLQTLNPISWGLSMAARAAGRFCLLPVFTQGSWCVDKHVPSTRLLTGRARTRSHCAGHACQPSKARKTGCSRPVPPPCPSLLPLHPGAGSERREGRSRPAQASVAAGASGLGSVPRAGLPPLLAFSLGTLPCVWMCVCAMGLAW